MTSIEVITLLIVTVALALGGWIGLRLAKRLGVKTSKDAPLNRKLVVVLLITGAVLVGVWLGNGGAPIAQLTIYVGVVIWLIAMFAAFRNFNRGGE